MDFRFPFLLLLLLLSFSWVFYTTAMEQLLFYQAARDGNVTELRKILREHPTVDVNWKNKFGWSALHEACGNDHPEVVSLLLAHPDIMVNNRSWAGSTPFLWACREGRPACVRILLEDPRVDYHLPDEGSHTPLDYAARFGHMDVIRWWMISGRLLLNIPSAMARAQAERKSEANALLQKFLVNRRDAALLAREGIKEAIYQKAGDVFALVVFLCDGLLQHQRQAAKTEKSLKARRFFRMVQGLPLELQMILCHRVVRSMGMNIPGKHVEASFARLATRVGGHSA